MGDTGKIEKELFVDDPVLPPTVHADKVEVRKRQEVGVDMDGWWSTPEGQDLIRELTERYSDDTRYERSRMNGYEHPPTIVEMIGLYPEKDILKAARPNFKPPFSPHPRRRFPLLEMPQQVEQVSKGVWGLPSYVTEVLKDLLWVLAIRATHMPCFL